jgi:hypothetical protein
VRIVRRAKAKESKLTGHRKKVLTKMALQQAWAQEIERRKTAPPKQLPTSGYVALKEPSDTTEVTGG